LKLLHPGCSITTLTTSHEFLHAQNYKINGNIEFLQPHPVVAADEFHEIGMAIISAFCHLMSAYQRQIFPVSQNHVTSQCIILFGISLSGYALINAS
jgi:hypothetical protein